MFKGILWLLIFIPQLAMCQTCEYFNTLTKTQLDSIGWDGSPNNGWSVNKTGAYQGKSLFLSAGIGGTLNVVSGCNSGISIPEVLSLQYTFNSGSGVFRVGIQDGFAAAGTGVVWLDTLPVVNTWTSYSFSFTPVYNPYRIVTGLVNTNASTKIGIDNFCLANSDFVGVCTLLPIALNSFSAEVLNTTSADAPIRVKLSWETQSEQNSKSFVILRSGNNLNFDSIGVVKAAVNNSCVPVSYSYEDNIVGSGETYYRLKSVDNDDSYSLSNIVSVVIPDSNEPSWFVSDGVFHYSGTDHTQLEIYSMQGQIVYNKMLFPNLNENLNFLTPGIYFGSCLIRLQV